MECNYVWTNGW